MDRPYIERFRVQNYGCVKDATLELTPLHALIGPNDSGKSTLLRALRTLTTLAAGGFNALADQDRLLALDALRTSQSHGEIAFDANVETASWKITFTRDGMANGNAQETLRENAGLNANFFHLMEGATLLKSRRALARALQGSQLLRLEADALRQRSALPSRA